MRLLAYDPFVSPDRGRQMSVDLVPLPKLMAESDFVTIHLPKTAETVGLLDREMLGLAKRGVRIVNTARGGIVDEEALAWAITEGIVAGAALDVFAEEPTTKSPLFDLDSVVVTPHLGASTREAQDKAGDTIAEQVMLALAGEFVPFAVNVSAAEASESAVATVEDGRPRIIPSRAGGRLTPSVVGLDPQRRARGGHGRAGAGGGAARRGGVGHQALPRAALHAGTGAAGRRRWCPIPLVAGPSGRRARAAGRPGAAPHPGVRDDSGRAELDAQALLRPRGAPSA